MYLSSHKEKHCFLATEKKKGYTFPVLNFSRQLQYSSLSKRSLTPTTKPYPTPTTKHYPWNIWAPGFYIEDQVSAKDYKSHLPINMEVEKSVPNQKLLFHPTKRSTVFTLYSLSNYVCFHGITLRIAYNITLPSFPHFSQANCAFEDHSLGCFHCTWIHSALFLLALLSPNLQSPTLITTCNMKETIFVEMTRIIQPTVANDMVERTNLNYHIYCQYVAPALRMNLPYFTCTFLTPPSAPPKDLVVMTDLSWF